MTVGQSSIYFVSRQVFNFDEAINFFVNSGLHLIQPKTQNIIALDEEGNSYEVEYEIVRPQAICSDFFNIKLWLDFASYIVWTFRSEHNIFVQDFHFYPLDDMQIEQTSKVIFDFFISLLSTNYLLGMYIDKFGNTEDNNWDNFFLNEDSTFELLPDVLCIRKDKSKQITAMMFHHIKTMLDDYILITSDVQILLGVQVE